MLALSSVSPGMRTASKAGAQAYAPIAGAVVAGWLSRTLFSDEQFN